MYLKSCPLLNFSYSNKMYFNFSKEKICKFYENYLSQSTTVFNIRFPILEDAFYSFSPSHFPRFTVYKPFSYQMLSIKRKEAFDLFRHFVLVSLFHFKIQKNLGTNPHFPKEKTLFQLFFNSNLIQTGT